jgi:hypothetical protein
MQVTTEHKFINKYPINSNSKYLIIGTIHPHRTDDFMIDFFYGNVNSLWSILSEAFPKKDFSNKENIIKRLDESKTSISDIIKKCDRKDASVTKDKDLYNLCFNMDQLRTGIKNSSISKIFLTSRFGKNNAAKLFVDNFKINYKESWNEGSSSFLIPKEIFGREITAIVLFSPSGIANVGISRSRAYTSKRSLYKDKKAPVSEFKVDFYREKFAYFSTC